MHDNEELFALECSKAGFNDTELESPLLPVEDERIDSNGPMIDRAGFLGE